MVVRKKKKVRQFRGQRTYGWGSHKKHRGKGSRGGRGMAGMHKQKRSLTIRYYPDHFGKKGFKRPPEVVSHVKAINLKELDKIAEGLVEKKIAEKENDKIKINLSKLGYDKVLGTGKLTKPLIIEAKSFSKQAIKKIEDAKGKALVAGVEK